MANSENIKIIMITLTDKGTFPALTISLYLQCEEILVGTFDNDIPCPGYFQLGKVGEFHIKEFGFLLRLTFEIFQQIYSFALFG